MFQRRLTLICALQALLLMPALSVADIDRRVPNCALTALNPAQGYDLQQFKGQVLYVDFWASWCGPCAKSFPFLNNLETDFQKRGLKIVAINMDEELEAGKKFLTLHPANFTVALDPSKQCAPAFDVQAMPSSYLVDRKGFIRKMTVGFKQADTEQLRTTIEQLLKE